MDQSSTIHPIIKVALVGLSGAPPDKYEGTSWTVQAHLPFLTSSPHFSLVGLLNTSVASAKAAIARYRLPASTKTYGSPEELANDTSIDLIVVSTRVDRHFSPIHPSLLAGGKTIFVEWPLERDVSIARQMSTLATSRRLKTMVGIQGSFAPPIRKLKEFVEHGRLGIILASTIVSSLGNGGTRESKNVRYFLDREVGGNVVSVHVGHSLEYIASVLGEFKTWDSLMSIGNSEKDIIDPSKNNEVIVINAPNNVPDQILLHGTTNRKIPVSIHFRGGPPFPGTPALTWDIQGTVGSLRLTSSSWSLNTGRQDTKIEWFDGSRRTVEIVNVGEDEFGDLPMPARNIARMYEALRKEEWVPDFEWAVKRHEMLDQMWRQFDANLK